MKKIATLVLLLLASVVAAQEKSSLFDLGFLEGGLAYSVWGLKFDLPPQVRITPVFPGDLQPGQKGIARKATVDADFVGTLDFSLSVRPPVEVLDHVSLSYVARYVAYGDLEHGYHNGIADYEQYVQPAWLAYTYTKLDRTDAFVLELALNVDVPIGDGYSFLGGCRYLFPFGMKWEQGWDRYAEEVEWRSSDVHMSGFAPYIGIGYADPPAGAGWNILVSKARYKMEWDDYADTHCDSWGVEFGITVKF